MGCGCKNNQNQTSAEEQKKVAESLKEVTIKRDNDLKDSIKKTVEKYYNVNKSSGSNGWVKN
jgi:hypothetical protein